MVCPYYTRCAAALSMCVRGIPAERLRQTFRARTDLIKPSFFLHRPLSCLLYNAGAAYPARVPSGSRLVKATAPARGGGHMEGDPARVARAPSVVVAASAGAR